MTAPLPDDVDFTACRRALERLCDSPAPDAAGPEADAILRLAARLVRQSKQSQKRASRLRDNELRGTRPIHAGPASADLAAVTPGTAVLAVGRSCYICKRPYTRLHHFYDALCPDCGDRNFAKRGQTADLRGRTAVVTGARVKIGYQTTLGLLRAGARVIATTRFPCDAARRYAAEPDADAWGDRLSLHPLDLRVLGAVEQFTAAVAQAFPALDILVQNAAQTVRRPPAFYRHLCEAERVGPEALPPPARRLVQPGGELLPTVAYTAAWLPAELSQLALLPGDAVADAAAFPPGQFDADGQQVDLRPQNSWGLQLREVSTVELLEVHVVNCLAPFLLLRGLEPAFRAGPDRDRFVVLVSAVEGQFGGGPKAGRHPHTNMAKAALNMLTRTTAESYAADRIFVTSVDTGWMSNEAAAPVDQRMRQEGFRPPLDAVDAAARVLDPIFSGVNTGVCLSGVYLKDYQPAPW